MTDPEGFNFDLDPPRTLRELEKWAEKKAIPGAYEWVCSAAGEGLTSELNKEIFNKTALIPRVLRDVSNINTTSDFFGTNLDIPLIIGPLGHLTQFHKDGEAELARGAEGLDTIASISTLTRLKISDIREAAPDASLIWQVYFYGDRNWVKKQIQEAKKNGCIAIAVCVDAPIRPVRYLDRETRYDARKHGRKTSESVPEQSRNALTTWEDIKWLKDEVVDMPLLVKGIMSAEDAALASNLEVDAIWVSNHGGRQLESGLSTLEVIEGIRNEVGSDMKIIFDGGIRRGTDVLKALALGADVVAIGRLAVFGLISGGSKGVKKVHELLKEELIASMAMCGINDINNINSNYIKKRWNV